MRPPTDSVVTRLADLFRQTIEQQERILAPNYWRASGGNIKYVTGVDNRRTGLDAIRAEDVKNPIGWCYHRPGLYLDVNISGSRYHPSYDYRLLRLNLDGTAAVVCAAVNSHDSGAFGPFCAAIEEAAREQATASKQAKLRARSGGPEDRLGRLQARRARLLDEMRNVDAEIAVLVEEMGGELGDNAPDTCQPG